MSYILKNTTALVNTVMTDMGRQKLAQGNFNVSYFQIGDSEVTYNVLPPTYNQFNTQILKPSYNAQNNSGAPQSNKQNVKYPFYVDGSSGNTYGIPYQDQTTQNIFNAAAPRGFFTGDTINLTDWKVLTNNLYVVNSNYTIDMSTLNGTNKATLVYSMCNPEVVREPAIGDIITIYFDGNGKYNCNCQNLPEPTPTPTISLTPSVTSSPFSTPTPTPSATNTNPCLTPTPSTTPQATFCPTPTPSRYCPPPPPPDCTVNLSSCYPILTYKIVDKCLNEITLDRNLPDFSYLSTSCFARTIVYPPSMVPFYDSYTPLAHWRDDVINFESVCGIDEFEVKIWNMNIPWSESPAGLNNAINKDFTQFGSVGYLGTKEYLGYASDSGQTITDSVYIYNSFDDKIIIEPKEQKAISILHYTNNSIDNFYGEKFALQPFNPLVQDETSGLARAFKVHIPWLMWHKNPDCCNGQTFWVDPPGFDNLNLFKVQFIQSTKNTDMNDPGIRYYNLWDTNPNKDGYPSRVGKVFPDSKIIVFDDEEIIAAMSYKSNRNWTLPAPKVSLITPNLCGEDNNSDVGILTGITEYLYVTYRLSNTEIFTNSLHCNYYIKIQGPNTDCLPITSQNVAVRFGPEFGCLSQPLSPITTTTTTLYPVTTTTTTHFTTTTTTICPPFCNIGQGFYANKFELLVQKVVGNERPDPAEWRVMDMTNQLSASTLNGFITQQGLTGNTFVVTQQDYDNAPLYDLNDYISLTPLNYTGTSLNFGDEFYFYGLLETDIQATIYEMKYKINLSQSEFQVPSNPTWSTTKQPTISEIALYDSEKNLMVISKLQYPVSRQGIQQFVIKLDF